jgi:hypothetical protein
MTPKITRTTANRILKDMSESWACGPSGLIKRIDKFHIHQNGRCLTRYRFLLKCGVILDSFSDWRKYNNCDPHSVIIESLHKLCDKI